MSEKRTNCPDCGGALPAGTPRQLCPHCLLRLGVRSPVAGAGGGSVGVEEVGSEPGEMPGARIGRYVLVEAIGQGGFGTVWVAEQREPVRRRVALKILKLGMDTREVVARFEAERQALALMEHPNIARVFDGGATGQGRPYFVMELVKGVRITEYCDQGRLTTEERLRLFMDVCRAVQHAHQKGVIHRDLKPSNVLVTERDGRPVAKVIDFGIAKAVEEKLTEETFYTRFNQVLGTPAYMSPEQAGLGSLDVDTRSDVYSLGVLLYELLTGQVPFPVGELRRAGIEEVLRTIREKEPTRPSTRLSWLGPDELAMVASRRGVEPGRLGRLVRGELDWIVLKALEKDRSRRYDSPAALALDLERYLGHEPVSAAAPGLAYQAGKFARRHRVVLATTLAFVVVLIAGAAISAWQAIRATRLADAEARQRGAAERAGRDAAEQRNVAVAAQLESERQRRLAETNLLAARRHLYVADMAAASQSIQLSIPGKARTVLNRHRPGPGAVDLREWEWRYLMGECADRSDFSLPHPATGVLRARFTPEGRHVVILGRDVAVWNWPERTLARRLGSPEGAAMALDSTGTLCAFGENGTIAVHRVADGGLSGRIRLPVRESQGPARPKLLDVVFAPDGKALLASFSQGTDSVRHTVFSWPDGRELNTWTLRDIAASWGSRVAWAPDGSRLALGGSGGAVMIIKLPEATLERRISAHEENITALLFSPDSRQLAVGSGYLDTLIRLYDIEDGWRLRMLRGHKGWVRSLVYGADGRRLYSASADQTVRIWDADSGANLRVLYGFSREATALAITPDDRVLLAGSDAGEVRGWDLARLRGDAEAGISLPYAKTQLDRELRWFAGLAGDKEGSAVVGEVTAFGRGEAPRVIGTNYHELAMAPDGSQVAGLDDRGVRLRVWTAATGGTVERRVEGEHGMIYVGFMAGGQIVTVDEGSTVRRWTRALEPAGEIAFPDTAGTVRCAFVPGTDYLVWWRSRSGTRLLDTRTGEIVGRTTRILVPVSASLSPDGGQLLVGDDKSNLWIWERAKWGDERGLTALKGHMSSVHAVAHAPDGRRFVSSGTRDIVIWDAATRGEVCVLPSSGGRCTLLQFSPDGQRFAHGLERGGSVRVVSPPPLTRAEPSPPAPVRGARAVFQDSFAGAPALPWRASGLGEDGHSFTHAPGALTMRLPPATRTRPWAGLTIASSELALTNHGVGVMVEIPEGAGPVAAGLILERDERSGLAFVVERAAAAGGSPAPVELVALRLMDGRVSESRHPLGQVGGPVRLAILRNWDDYHLEFRMEGRPWERVLTVAWEFYGPERIGVGGWSGAGAKVDGTASARFREFVVHAYGADGASASELAPR